MSATSLRFDFVARAEGVLLSPSALTTILSYSELVLASVK